MPHDVLGVYEIGEAQGMGHDPGVGIVLDFASDDPDALTGVTATFHSDSDVLYEGDISAAQVHAGATSVFLRGVEFDAVAAAASATLAT